MTDLEHKLRRIFFTALTGIAMVIAMTTSGCNQPTIKACTEEAKLCPDKETYVGRTAPFCDFQPCPDCCNLTYTGTGAYMPNPASAFCTCMGGASEIVTAQDGSQSGVCKIAGTTIDEWEYFRQGCPSP